MKLHTRIRSFLGFALVALGLFSTGCPAETMTKIIKADHSIANALDKTEKATWDFYQTGVLDREDYLFVNTALTDINDLSRDFHSKARTYETFDVSAKADLLKLSSDIHSTIATRINDGSLRIKDLEARRRWRAVADNIYASWSLVVEIISNAKPTAPAPAEKGVIQ